MILDSLILQTKLFLSGDMGIEITKVEIDEDNPAKLLLKDYTSMIGTGGSFNAMIVVSFDNDMLEHLVELFMEGEEVEDEEKEEIYDSVSGETINTIIGLALPTFPNRGKGVTITPPITINDASNIKKYRDSNIVSAIITTEVGTLSISALGQDEMLK